MSCLLKRVHCCNLSQHKFIFTVCIFAFSGKGNGKKANQQINKAINSILESAEDGRFDMAFGEKQLEVAAIRLAEDPEYICNPGSVVRDNLCSML